MCGRFTLTVDPSQLEDMYPWVVIPHNIAPRYNIAPGQPVACIPNVGEPQIEFFNWGLVPPWAKDPSIGVRMINARAETLSEKPSFRMALKRRRCLILADGFYEWQQSTDSRGKIPIYIRLTTKSVFAFAGLWEIWKSPHNSEIHTCAIITTQPNSLVAPIHNRMPVILPMGAQTQWISPGEINPNTIQQLLTPYPSEDMEAFPVSKVVNNPLVDSPDLILPIQP